MITQSASKRGWVVCDTEFGLLAVRAARRLRYQHLGRFWIRLRIVLVVMPLGKMRVRSLDLHEALTANLLVAASGSVQIWRVVQEANRAFCAFFVKENLHRLSVHKRVSGKVDFPWREVVTRSVP